MRNGNWGHCMHCRHFGSPAARPLDAEEASCKQPTLVRFALKVNGSNGCNAFELREGLEPDVEPRPQVGAQPSMPA